MIEDFLVKRKLNLLMIEDFLVKVKLNLLKISL